MNREQTVIYLAGIFDDEGWVGIVGGNSYPMRVSCMVKMTNREVPELLQSTFGGSVGEKYWYERNGHRPQYCWQVTAATARKFLSEVYPYLIVKKLQVGLASLFWDSDRLEREHHRELIRSLNNGRIS